MKYIQISRTKPIFKFVLSENSISIFIRGPMIDKMNDADTDKYEPFWVTLGSLCEYAR